MKAFSVLLLLPFFLLSCGDKEPKLSFEEQLKRDTEIIEAYLSEQGITATKTESGLHYIITDDGRQDGHPSAGAQVVVRYKGYYTNGEVFDRTQGTETISFSLLQVIKGWQEGVPLLSRGGKGTFFIPSYLGYGSNPPRGIPANAVLLFDIELVSF